MALNKGSGWQECVVTGLNYGIMKAGFRGTENRFEETRRGKSEHHRTRRHVILASGSTCGERVSRRADGKCHREYTAGSAMIR